MSFTRTREEFGGYTEEAFKPDIKGNGRAKVKQAREKCKSTRRLRTI